MNFTTIYPGWYSGRAVHIHFKLRIYAGTTKTADGYAGVINLDVSIG